ncbi:GNAT family N-acetyltransferase [Croceicoccus mobilis]|uniref:N-acetyltransferase n=1 Tax=Croceicoccus mobilis TaxID=1703339 RepID=A0A917DUE1_9SPHN|nr:GNAT family N-acetyltransferase [Croceicoccus mobilis]GGD71328.1 N-acetyltransferase [Croceicoccus mobilis]
MSELKITRDDGETGGEYRAHPEDTNHIGRLTYKKRGDVLIAEHTLVPPAIGGRGIAARLVERLVEDARAEGKTIVPQCSYVDAAFRKHPEWADLKAA